MRCAKLFITTIIAVLLLNASYAFAGPQHTGVVLEAASGGGYTYLKVDENGETFWIAGPEAPVSTGATVSFSEQIWMPNFTSKALNRTFEKILFVDGIYAASPETSPSAEAQDAPAKPAQPATAYTIKEIYTKRYELSGQPVKVRGNVVKVSENIMGKTWVHIKDGTGNEGRDTLIFLSKGDSAAVGSVVTAEGVLETDKNFGFGYFYSVIVDGSTFSE